MSEHACGSSGEGVSYIYRASILLPNGTRIYAKQFGKRAFKIPVSPDNDNDDDKVA